MNKRSKLTASGQFQQAGGLLTNISLKKGCKDRTGLYPVLYIESRLQRSFVTIIAARAINYRDRR